MSSVYTRVTLGGPVASACNEFPIMAQLQLSRRPHPGTLNNKKTRAYTYSFSARVCVCLLFLKGLIGEHHASKPSDCRLTGFSLRADIYMMRNPSFLRVAKCSGRSNHVWGQLTLISLSQEEYIFFYNRMTNLERVFFWYHEGTSKVADFSTIALQRRHSNDHKRVCI